MEFRKTRLLEYSVNIHDIFLIADINECVTGYHLCGSNTVCENLPGSYNCSCLPGYRSQGYDSHTCINIDECAENADSNGCEQFCEDTEGGFHCNCYPGYQLADDGKSCQDVDECAPGVLNECSDFAECLNTNGSFSCMCMEGYTGDGFSCTGR